MVLISFLVNFGGFLESWRNQEVQEFHQLEIIDIILPVADLYRNFFGFVVAEPKMNYKKSRSFSAACHHLPVPM